MAIVRLVLGLGMTVVLPSGSPARGCCTSTGSVASASRSSPAGVGKPVTSPAPRSSRSPASGSCCSGPLPGSRTSPSSGASCVLVLTDPRGVRGAVLRRPSTSRSSGTGRALGFLEDLFAVLCLLAVVAFTVIRLRESPREQGRSSRFFGSHLDAAWFTLFMIVNVVWTPPARPRRPDQRQDVNTTDNLPFLRGAFVSQWVASLLEPLGRDRQRGHRDGRPPARPGRAPGVHRVRRPTASTCTSCSRCPTSPSRADPAPSARCCRCTPTARPSTSRTPARTT